MSRVEHDGHPKWLEMGPNTVGDFGGETFLNLEATGVSVQHAGELGNADDAVAGKIGDMRLADDRRHVMLAMGQKRDVLEKDDVVVTAGVLKRSFQMYRGLFFVAPAILAPSPGNAFGRVDQAFSVRIVSRPPQQGTNGFFNLRGDDLRRDVLTGEAAKIWCK
jgi:hypothetical protein